MRERERQGKKKDKRHDVQLYVCCCVIYATLLIIVSRFWASLKQKTKKKVDSITDQ